MRLRTGSCLSLHRNFLDTDFCLEDEVGVTEEG
jgi:hypothetical protein